jgi:hypothetical protein
MSNLELINKLPDSIFAIGPDSNNYKLWKLFSVFMDEIDTVFEDIRLITEIQSNTGAQLDLAGKILRQKRQGWPDDKYIQYLSVAIKKYQCSGSIPDLNEICRILADSAFLYIRDMNEPELEDAFWLDGSQYLDESGYLSGDIDNPDSVYMDGSQYLDGSFYLSGDICQPGFFEVVFSGDITDETISFISAIIGSCKGGGIKYRIRTEG